MKKKSRLKKWLIGIGFFLVLLLAGAYFGINYAADKVMDKLSDSILETVISSPTSTQVEGGHSSDPTDPASPSAPAKNTESENAVQAVTNDSSKAEAGNPPLGIESDSNEKSSGSTTKDSDYAYNAEVSVDKAVAVKEDITFAEKTKLMTIMLKRLNANDIKTLSELAGGGLSVEKKKEAKKIILEKLSEKEYDELIKIAQKYGMSEGKSYEDSKKEKGMQ